MTGTGIHEKFVRVSWEQLPFQVDLSTSFPLILCNEERIHEEV